MRKPEMPSDSGSEAWFCALVACAVAVCAVIAALSVHADVRTQRAMLSRVVEAEKTHQTAVAVLRCTLQFVMVEKLRANNRDSAELERHMQQLEQLGVPYHTSMLDCVEHATGQHYESLRGVNHVSADHIYYSLKELDRTTYYVADHMFRAAYYAMHNERATPETLGNQTFATDPDPAAPLRFLVQELA